MTRSLNVTPKTAGQNLIVCTGKSVVVTVSWVKRVLNCLDFSNSKACSTDGETLRHGIDYTLFIKKLTTDGHKASRSLCDNRTSCRPPICNLKKIRMAGKKSADIRISRIIAWTIKRFGWLQTISSELLNLNGNDCQREWRTCCLSNELFVNRI